MAPMTRRIFAGVTGAAALVALAACTPQATSVAVNVTGSADLNGGGVPARATVYYLRSTAKFNSLDYAALAGDPQAALGADLISTSSVVVSPGQARQLSASFDGDVPVAVGVVAGFRAIDTAKWRATTSISGGKANALTVAMGSGAVSISRQ